MFGDIGGSPPPPPPPSGLAGKVAPVTGGSRGIGAATCHALAANGAGAAVNGRGRAAIGDGGRRGDVGRAVLSLASNASPRGAGVTPGLTGGRVIV